MMLACHSTLELATATFHVRNMCLGGGGDESPIAKFL